MYRLGFIFDGFSFTNTGFHLTFSLFHKLVALMVVGTKHLQL